MEREGFRSVFLVIAIVACTIWSPLIAGDATSASTATSLIKHANELYEAKQFAAADKAYSAALVKMPAANSALYSKRGRCRLQLGNYESAIADLDQAIKIDPQNAFAFNWRGDAWLEQKKFDRAIDDYSRAITLNPKSAEAYCYRGWCWMQKEKGENAFADFNRSLALDGDLVPAYLGRAKMWLHANRDAIALIDVEEAIKRNPKDDGLYFFRSVIWGRQGNDEKLMADLNRAIELDSQNTDARIVRGDAQIRLHKFSSALKDYQATIEIGGRQELAALNRAAMLLSTCPDKDLRDHAAAVRYAETSCELTKWKEWVHIATLATTHAQAGQFAKAIELHEKAISIAPPNAQKKLKARLLLYVDGTRPY